MKQKVSNNFNRPHLVERQDRILSCAFEVISREFASEALSVETLSTSCGVSRRVLERVFRERLNQSPLEVINHRRIRIARQLMLRSEAPISEIAPNVGYADVKSLRHHFRQLVGITPGVWRQSQKTQTSL